MISQIKSRLLTGVASIKAMVSAGVIMLSMGVAAPGAYAASAVSIDAGGNFNCALTSAGGVQCWGSNSNGQLGTGVTGGYSNKPVDVFGLTSGVAAVALGHSTACALTTAGTVKCWGSNSNGLLGNGSTVTNVNKPVDVPGVSGATAISVGGAACVALASGGVKCWGVALGNGQSTSVSLATVVGSMANVVDVAAGAMHSCALLNTGGVQCWGNGTSGQLGNGGKINSTLRVDVMGVNDAVAITAGSGHTCYRSVAGAVKCWGLNSSGQIGDGTTTNALVPVMPSGLSSGVISISSSPAATNSCVVMMAGEVRCWGTNAFGQLGTGDKNPRNVPTPVVGLSGPASAVATGASPSCAMISGNLQCWGGNNSGELGAGDIVAYPFPVNVVGFSGSAPSMAPATISPVTSNTPVYTWKPILGASNYRLDVNGVISTYTAAQAGCDGGFGLCTVTSAALAAGSYTWYVQGYNTFGAGPWSAATNFRL